MNTPSSFVQNFVNQLQGSPKIQEIRLYENKIRKVGGFFVVIILLSIVPLLVTQYTSYWQDYQLYFMIFFAVAFVSIFLLSILTAAKHKQYSDSYKNIVVGGLMHKVDDRFEYHPSAKIAEADFNEAHLFYSRYNRYRGEDLFTAKIDYNHVQFSDLHVAQKSSRGGRGRRRRSRESNVFTGQFYVFDIGRPVTQGNVYFVRDKQGWLANSLEKVLLKMGKKDRGEIVDIPDLELEKEFRLIAEIKGEGMSFYSHLAPIINFLRTNDPESSFVFSVIKNKFYLAVENNSARFEKSFSKDILDPKLLQTYVDDFVASVKIIDYVVKQIKVW